MYWEGIQFCCAILTKQERIYLYWKIFINFITGLLVELILWVLYHKAYSSSFLVAFLSLYLSSLFSILRLDWFLSLLDMTWILLCPCCCPTAVCRRSLLEVGRSKCVGLSSFHSLLPLILCWLSCLDDSPEGPSPKKKAGVRTELQNGDWNSNAVLCSEAWLCSKALFIKKLPWS